MELPRTVADGSLAVRQTAVRDALWQFRELQRSLECPGVKNRARRRGRSPSRAALVRAVLTAAPVGRSRAAGTAWICRALDLRYEDFLATDRTPMKHRFYEGIQMALSSVRVRSVFRQWLRSSGICRIEFRSWNAHNNVALALQYCKCGLREGSFLSSGIQICGEGRCSTATSEKTLRASLLGSCWGIPTRSKRTLANFSKQTQISGRGVLGYANSEFFNCATARCTLGQRQHGTRIGDCIAEKKFVSQKELAKWERM